MALCQCGTRPCMSNQYHSLSCWRNQVLTVLTTSSSDSNFLLWRASSRGLKRWKSEGVELGLQGGCSNTIQQVLHFLILDTGVRPSVIVLCWSNISRRFLSGWTLWKHLLIFCSVLMYASELIVVPLCITSRKNHCLTVPEHHDHHVSGRWKTSRSCAFPTSHSLALFA